MGFWQAVSIWLCTVATLGGQPGLDRKINIDTIVMTAAIPATINTFLRDFGFLARPGAAPPAVDESLGALLGRRSAAPGVGPAGPAPDPDGGGQLVVGLLVLDNVVQRLLRRVVKRPGRPVAGSSWPGREASLAALRRSGAVSRPGRSRCR